MLPTNCIRLHFTQENQILYFKFGKLPVVCFRKVIIFKQGNWHRYTMGGSPGELSEELVMQEKQKKGWRLNHDVGEAMEGLENEL